jgi:phosphate acetyltransferase
LRQAVRAVHAKKGALVFADCGLVVDPDTAELADIAVTSAESFETLMDATPRVAMACRAVSPQTAHRPAADVGEEADREEALLFRGI